MAFFQILFVYVPIFFVLWNLKGWNGHKLGLNRKELSKEFDIMFLLSNITDKYSTFNYYQPLKKTLEKLKNQIKWMKICTYSIRD